MLAEPYRDSEQSPWCVCELEELCIEKHDEHRDGLGGGGVAHCGERIIRRRTAHAGRGGVRHPSAHPIDGVPVSWVFRFLGHG